MALYGRKRARRSLFHTVNYRILAQLFTILGYVVMVRAMSEHDFGIYSLFYAFIPLASTVASFGLEQTLRRYQPEYLQDGNAAAAAWLVRVISSTRFVTNVVLLALIFLTWNLSAPLFGLENYRIQFVWFSILLLLYFQARILQLTLASHMLHRYSVGALALVSGAKLVGYVALMSVQELTLQNALLVDLSTYVLQYAFLKWKYVRHCLPEVLGKFTPSKEERRRLLRYGFYNNFNDVGTLVLASRTDTFFIAAFVNTVAVGAYAFYTRMNEMIVHSLPTRMFDNLLQPLFFAIPAQQARERLPRYFTLLVNMNLLMQLPLMAYVAAYHAEIVQVLFHGKFLSESPLLPLIVAFATLNVIATPATYVAQYDEKLAVLLWSKVAAIYNVVAMLILLPTAGLYGAAIATGSAQLMKSLIVWWSVRRDARWLNLRQVILMTLLVWGGVTAICNVLKWALPAPPLVHLLAGGIICGLGLLIYVRTPAISSTDRELLASVFHGREAKILGKLGMLPANKVSQDAD